MNLRKKAKIGMSIEERTYVDVVPLVDTLLAVFLFLAILAFQSPMVFLAVKLPQAQTGKKTVVQTMRVEILPNGQYILNGQYVTLTDIQNAIQNTKVNNQPINDLIIEADENTLEKYVVALMDVAKQNGIKNILIATRMKR
ncbi:MULTISPECIES: biopolymer transporter ExbD [unclassified Hydrogenobaculum]|uniref:ExbD/TolR family protein n=1 Tax=unclassified Hydrogenobaculum TaxID=2622382 RepID=UPI0001C527DF|nr:MULTISPECIES: biopolymer transporter ExbD [unclassified Hydrogenobaculum]AEF19341.1 Biopolymer transport protein ExbD/TolR [Hydrogenobaculum sp. 3684]AEG46630.1 Biopolymer transport protein ExbD/TolR [Hydrogenobaculum sp. SHO]AGG15274.1 Biopolymer transport protein ExbD/TolR [Hydrogenobaculum sp. HO]AGH93576.1 biopolymer transport protein [Hydrogenobaculum sp. SN]